MLKLGSFLYIHTDEIAAIAFDEDNSISVFLSGNPEPFVLSSQEAKEEIVHWLRDHPLGGR